MNFKIYSFLGPCLLCSLFCSAQISVSIVTPKQYQNIGNGLQMTIVGNTLDIRAQVTSTYQLSSVKASVLGREATLAYNGWDFSGSLSLVGMKHGDTLDLKVTATDYLNNQQTASRKVIYDVRPVITIESPVKESVARPTIRLKLKCEDVDSCFLYVSYPESYMYNNVLFRGRIKNSLDTILNLSAFNGSSGELYVSAFDGRSQETRTSVFIHVDANPYLQEILTSDTKIIDFNHGRVLVPGKETVSRPELIDVNTKQKTVIPFKGEIKEYSLVTPYGALIDGVDSSRFPARFSRVFDYNRGTIYDLGFVLSGRFLKNAGKYATWIDSYYTSGEDATYLRDLETKQNILLSKALSDNDVAANGFVAFTASDANISNIYTYKDGIKTKISTNLNVKSNHSPLTDGKNIVYLSYKESCCGSLKLYNGQSTIIIADSLHYNFSPYTNYQINNKFVAYTKLGNAGQTQVWLRDSSGLHSQISFFGDYTTIELLTPRGDVVYNRPKNRYIKLRSGESYEISRLGKTYFYDSTFYVAIGRSLFKVLAACNVNARFTRSGSTNIPATISFTNQSTPDSANTAYKWYFGNGDSSTAKNPVYTYRSPGTYYVRMVATRGSCTSSFSDTILICNLTAGFTYSGSTTAPAAITFTNQSTPDSAGTAYKWHFGNSDSTSVKSPVYTHQKPGTYKVRLTASKGNCINSKDTVIVIKECIIQPKFTYAKDSTQINRFTFENKTTSPFTTLKYSWDFGDGSKDTSKNGQHAYTQAGNFNVCLQVTETGSCIKTYCENVTVTLPPGRINVSPNPVQNTINVYLNAEKNSTYVLRITNFSGLVVKEVTYPAVPGANYILINVADLAPGYYVITADNQQEQLQFKFMKL